jgi:hypothetical protein
MQGDLFAPEPAPRRCGTCVIWNGLPGDAAGDCSREGRRLGEAPACPEWFPLHELRKPLYGGRQKRSA